MKTLFFAAFFTIFASGFAFAEPIRVTTSQVGPFNCSHSKDRARTDLVQQCDSIDMLLTDFSTTGCFKSGDDGGYVEYFTLTAEGLCIEKKAKVACDYSYCDSVCSGSSDYTGCMVSCCGN